MKTAVVYYTRFGHTEVVAQRVAERLSAELFHIEEARSYLLPELARSIALCHFEIKPMNLDFTTYERMVLCTPIWMREPACPARTFLRDARLAGPEIAVLLSSASGDIAHAVETVAGYLARQGAKLGQVGGVLTAKVTDQDLRQAADNFIGHVLTADRLPAP